MILLSFIIILILAVFGYYGYKHINKPVAEPVINNYSVDIEKLLKSSEEQTMILKAIVNKPSTCKFEKHDCKGCDFSTILMGQEELKALQLTEEKVRGIFDSTTFQLEKQ